MRLPHALRNALRTRRTRRIDLDEADRLAAGDPPGPHHPGLGTLLDTLRAPGTPGELAGEKATVAAFAAHRRRAARTARRSRPTRPPTRVVVMSVTAALALLLLGGTALAARTGHLPDGAQQHAHRLFSALGVPAPRTGTHPSPAPSPSAPAAELGWCADWQPGGPSLSPEDHQRLRAVAGGENRIPDYCANLRRPTVPPNSPAHPAAPTSAQPAVTHSSGASPTSTLSDPTPSLPDPSEDRTHVPVRPGPTPD